MTSAKEKAELFSTKHATDVTFDFDTLYTVADHAWQQMHEKQNCEMVGETFTPREVPDYYATDDDERKRIIVALYARGLVGVKTQEGVGLPMVTLWKGRRTQTYRGSLLSGVCRFDSPEVISLAKDFAAQ